ncbi:B3 domain-containing protein REM16 [Linum perenne]
MYWTHFQCTHFCIFLPTGGDFLERIAMPIKFSNNLRYKLPETVTVRGPSRIEWNVGLTTANDGSVFFSLGWREFAVDNSLQPNDLLVFKYNGDSRFDVLIIDPVSSCEKVASYFAGKIEAPKRVHFTASNSTGTHEEVMELRVTKPVTVGEKEESNRGLAALRMAKSLVKREGSFISVMKPSHVCKKFHLSVPRTWMMKYIEEEEGEQEVILRRKKREWRVKLSIRRDPYRGGLCGGGWKKFASDNNLKQFDVCLFQLVSREDVTSRWSVGGGRRRE